MTVLEDRAAQRVRVERFAHEHPGSVLYDGATLLDVPSGKGLPLDWRRVASLEERRDTATGRPYLALRRDDGTEIAIAEQGVVFPPATDATGPLPGLPLAVCLRDLAVAEGQLSHFLQDHPGEAPGPAHVSLFMLCLAVVDGARAAGFDVAREERRLEAVLAALEARRRG